jgi:DNA helicase-2/ATP-dependent DNA helicase PcrA
MKQYVIRSHNADSQTSVANTTAKLHEKYAAELNPAQLEAVLHLNGPCLCIAGAGSGKTRTLIYRVACLIERGIAPESILLLTFTRKASQEMLRRAAAMGDSRCERVSGGTFHSFANAILRRYCALLEFPNHFTILDRVDAEDALSMLRKQMDISTEDRMFPKKGTLASIVSAARNKSLPIEKIIQDDYPQFEKSLDVIREIDRQYQVYKKENFLMDYDDLLLQLKRLLTDQPGIRKKLSETYRYIMVDEYQDTNKVQGELVQLLSSEHNNVMAVGDDSQSIYSFRGAHFKNIMLFPDSFANCKVIKLEENYRSTQPILDFTNQIMAGSLEKYDKNLFSSKKEGVKPILVATTDEHEQSEFIAQRILELREDGIELSQIAVLFRSGFLSFDLELELSKRNIPFIKMGGFKFMETSHVKDVLAYLRILDNPKDLVSWGRILPLEEKVGAKTTQRILERLAGSSLGFGLFAAEFADKKPLVKLGEYFQKVKQAENFTPADMTEAILDYYQPILMGKHDDYAKRKKDLEHFKSIAERFTNLRDLLTEMALEPPTASVADFAETDKTDELLTLSTIHSAKGLEWHTVFVLWVLDGRFPSIHAIHDEAQLEEERRLLYVATTRAEENLFLTHPINAFDQASGMVFSKPSRFIEEIPAAYYENLKLVREDNMGGSFSEFAEAGNTSNKRKFGNFLDDI